MARPEGANHALLVGLVLGALMKVGADLQLQKDELGEFMVEPLMEDGSYTNQLRIMRPSGSYLVTIEPEHGPVG